jgi:opacity protein-like surface antigen
MRFRNVLSAVTLATVLLPPASRADETNEWSFAVAPYLWLASLGAEASVPEIGSSASPGLQGLGTGVPRSVQEFDTRISGGFMLEAQARYRSVGLLVDFNWLRLNTESLNPGTLYSGVNLRSDYIYSTVALTYALPLRGKFHAEVEAGARIWSISTDFEAESGSLPGFQSSNNETWVSGLIGANLRYDLTRHWVLIARGTVGGLSNSSVQWDVFGGVGYQFNDWCMATLGYRYLHEDYSKDNFTFNAEAHGALLGVVFRF